MSRSRQGHVKVKRSPESQAKVKGQARVKGDSQLLMSLANLVTYNSYRSEFILLLIISLTRHAANPDALLLSLSHAQTVNNSIGRIPATGNRINEMLIPRNTQTY